MIKGFGVLFFCLLSMVCMSQMEWSNWHLDGTHRLTFKNNVAQLERDYIQPVPSYWYNYYYWSEFAASYSDPATGQMKFMVAGRSVWDKNYDMISPIFNLRSCPDDKFTYHIIPFQNDPNKFYIIQFQDLFGDLYAAESGLQIRCPNAIGLGYSVFDLRLNGGLGGITSENNLLLNGLTRGITLIRHANGKDVWAVVHNWKENKFYSFLFSDNGVAAPVISAIGPTVKTTRSESVLGTMVASHDGKTIARQMYDHNFIEFYDFNNGSGTLGSYRSVATPSFAKMMLFSPDDSKFYYLGTDKARGLYQYDLNVANVSGPATLIQDDPNQWFSDMQLGPDGKIYITSAVDPVDNDRYLAVIRCPNLPKYACNYSPKAFNIPVSNSILPVFVNDIVKQPKAFPTPEFSLGNDTAICFGEFKVAAPAGWQSYKWSTGDTSREITIKEPGLYYVLAGDEGFSCPSAFGSIRIKSAARQVNLGKDTIFCPGNIYTIDLSRNFKSLLWNDGTTDSIKKITSTGTYSVTAKDENGCTSKDTVNVGIKFDPRANFGNDTALCTNQTLVLQLLPKPNPFESPATFSWQNGSRADTFKVTQSGTYWGKVTYRGCTVADTIQVNYVNAQNINLGNDTTLCEGDSLVLKTNISNGSFLWNTGDTNAAIVARTNGTYWVRFNNGSCTITDTIRLSFKARPTLFLGGDTLLCEQQKLLLQYNGTNATYLWQDGSTKSSFEVTNAGTYNLKLTRDGCVTSDTISVRYNTLPPLNLGKDTAVCIQQTLLLNASNNKIINYRWQDGSTSSTYLAMNQGTYSVTVTGIDGCVNNDTIKISNYQVPVFTLGGDTLLCEKQELPILLSVAGAEYKWNTGDTTAGYTVKKAGTFWATVSMYGCTATDTVVVNYKPLPVIDLGRDTILCEGVTKLLTAANSGATYLWQDRSGASTYLVTKPGLYSASVTLDGCEKKDTVRVDYNYAPKFTLGNDTTLCTGDQLILDPKIRNASFLWSDGTARATITVQNPGSYKLIATNDCGSASDEIIIARGLCNLHLPNAFSPNNDGSNDLFRIKNAGFIKTFRINIFNRWGQVVFNSENAATGWDGRYKGMEQPAGTYIWVIRLMTNDGETIEQKGSVVLVR